MRYWPHRESHVVQEGATRRAGDLVRTMTKKDTLQLIDSSAIISSLCGVSFRSYVSDRGNGRFLVSPLILTEVKDEYRRKLARLGKNAGSFFPLKSLPEPDDLVATIRDDLMSMGVDVVETTHVPAETIASMLSCRQLGGPHRHGDLADILHALTLAREVVKSACDGILITGDGAFFHERRDFGQKTGLAGKLARLSSHHSSILRSLEPGIESYSISVLDPQLLALGHDDVPQDEKP